MKIKTLFKYMMPKIRATENVLLVFFETIGDEMCIKKIYINERYFELIFNLLRTDFKEKNINKFPKLREVHYKISDKHFNQILKLFDLDFNFPKSKKNIDDLNSDLSKKIILRTNVGFRIIEHDCVKLIIERNNEIFNRIKINDERIFNKSETKNKDLDLKLRIYNVGQANCSCLFINNLPGVFFDLGSMKHNKKLYSDFNNFTDVYVIISHFDNDHINAYNRFFPKKNRNKIKIIFPYENSIANLPINAQIFLFCAYLLNFELYPLSLDKMKINIFDNDLVCIFQGKYVNTINKITRRNALSLICVVNYNDNSVLIPGDSLYENFPTFFTPNHVIIPHHGCKCKYYGTNLLPNIDETKVIKSFVFCGPSMSYKHPNFAHLKHYFNDKMQIVYRFDFDKKKFKSGLFINGTEIDDSQDFTQIINGEYIDWNL